MNRRSFLGSLAVPLSASVAGCSGSDGKETVTVTRTVQVTPEETPTARVIEKTVKVTPEKTPTPRVKTRTVTIYKTQSPTPEPTSTPTPAVGESRKFSGSGDTLTEELQLDEGLTVVNTTHDSAEPFLVTLIPNGGSDEIIFANLDGDAGEYAHLAEGGSYFVEVGAGGDWTLEFTQPTPSTGQIPPIEISGSGNEVIGPFSLDGRYISDGSYNGKGNFIVQAYPLSGFFPTDVMRATDGVDSRQAFNFDGLCFFESDVEGDWSLTVREP